MAAQKGTVERLRQSGVGALSNAFGMAAFLRWDEGRGREVAEVGQADGSHLVEI